MLLANRSSQIANQIQIQMRRNKSLIVAHRRNRCSHHQPPRVEPRCFSPSPSTKNGVMQPRNFRHPLPLHSTLNLCLFLRPAAAGTRQSSGEVPLLSPPFGER
nr:hypothetical protein Iba_chr11aCG13190 [Ipomoea batatas]